MVLPVCSGFAVSEEYINVALYKTVKASGETEEHKAGLAIDNLNTNKYHTYWDSGESDGSSWLQIDLGVNYLVDRLELEAPGRAGSFGGFEVRASKTEDFYNYEVLAKSINSFSGSLWQVDLEPKDSYRYIKLVKNSGSMQVGEFRVLVKNTSISQGMFEETVEILELMPFAEDGSYISFSDIVGTGYAKPVNFLSAFQIMRGYTNGKFMPNENITRAEFVATVVRALGNKTVSTKGERYYGDVPTDHWAYDAINTATSMGLINGIEEKVFAPDNNITGVQALKIVCMALGYEPLIDYNGGYPDGVLAVSSELRLLEHLENGTDEPITRGEVAWLIYEALHKDVLTKTVFTENTLLGEVTKGENLLKLNHNVVSSTGRVLATDHSSLTNGGGALKDGYIKINSVIYREGAQNSDEFLGLDVKFYYQTDGEDVDKIIYMIPDKKIEMIELDSISIADYDEYSRVLSWYDEKDDIEKITILSTADVIYNNKAISTYTKKEIVPSEGRIVLYDLDGDDETAELVKIYAERIGVVKGINEKDGEIYILNSNEPVTFDKEKDDFEIYSSETNEKMDMSELKAGDVLNIMESTNEGKKVVTIYVTKSFVRGTAEIMTKDEIVIKGKTYKKAYNLSDVSVGSKGIFYFERNGKIAYFDGSDADEAKYGYLMKVREATDIDNNLEVKMYTSEGEFKEFIINEDAVLDGLEIKNYDDLVIKLSQSGRVANAYHQAVKYGVNVKDEIIYIDTTSQSGGIYYNDFEKEPPKSAKEAEVNTDKSRFIKQSIFDCNFTISKDATVLQVPDDMSKTKDFAVLSPAYFRQGTRYLIEAYDLGEEKEAKFILHMSSSANELRDSSSIVLVDSVEDAFVEDDTTKVLKAIKDGRYMEFYPQEKGVFDNLKKGDIIQISDINNKYVVDYRKVFCENINDLSNTVAICPAKPEYFKNSNMTNDLYFGYGFVNTNKNGFINVVYDLTNVAEENKPLRDSVMINTLATDLEIYVYDKARGKIYVGTKDDIKSADTVGKDNASWLFVNLGAVSAKTVVVFK